MVLILVAVMLVTLCIEYNVIGGIYMDTLIAFAIVLSTFGQQQTNLSFCEAGNLSLRVSLLAAPASTSK